MLVPLYSLASLLFKASVVPSLGADAAGPDEEGSFSGGEAAAEAEPVRRAERKKLEPFEVPTSGAFFMHDDRFGGDDAPPQCAANLPKPPKSPRFRGWNLPTHDPNSQLIRVWLHAEGQPGV